MCLSHKIFPILAGFLFYVIGWPMTALSQTNRESAGETVSVDSLVRVTRFNSKVYIPGSSAKRHLHGPLQLLKGRVPGLFIGRPGSDPNRQQEVRLRGLHTLINDPNPLYVIDGIPGLPLSLVDPRDIASVEIAKSGYASQWGLRGAGGVVHIKTRASETGKPEIHFQSYLAAEQPVRPYKVLDAATYIAYKRSLYGSYSPPSTQNNNWSDIITRTALSTVNSISLSGGTQALSYRGSLNWRNAEGIAINTGYDRLNGRITLQSFLLEQKLKLGLSIAVTSNRSRIGFEEAFKYAVSFNPSAPRQNNLSQYSQYGGYYQNNLFDYYNPLALLEQNRNEGEERMLSGILTASYSLDAVFEGLKANLTLAETREDLFRGEFYPSDSFFRGYDADGLAQTESDRKTNRMGEFSLTWDGETAGLDLYSEFGYTVQNLYHEYNLKQAWSLTSEESYLAIDSGDFSGRWGERRTMKEDHLLVAFYGNTRITRSENWFLELGFRHEGSSYLGPNNKWGTFPYIGAGFDATRLVTLPFLDTWTVRASYGIAGNLPRHGGWSKGIYSESGNYYYYDGEYRPALSLLQNKNPDLKWESTSMWNLGFDLVSSGNRLRSSIDLYLNKSSDLIVNAELPSPPFPASSGYLNMGEISNRGLEIALSYDAIHNNTFSFTTELKFSIVKTTYNTLSNEFYSLDNSYYGTIDGACGCSALFLRVQEGEPLGQFYGPVSEGFDQNGGWIIDNDDNRVIGNGLPSSFLGWSNRLSYKNWEVMLFFRGVFGHDLISETRLLYENRNMIANYNILESSPAGLEEPNTWNSYFVEDADFLKLDNLTVSYYLPLRSGALIKEVRLFAAADNLVVITGYSGSDPSVRLSNYPPVNLSTMYRYGNVLAPGIDRAASWLDSRTFLAGIDLRF